MARGYESHEAFWSDIKMHFAMLLRAIFLGMLFQILMIGFVVYNTGSEKIYVTGTNVQMPGSTFVKYHSGYAGLIGTQAEIEKELLPFANGWRKLPTIRDYKIFVNELTDNAYYYQHKKLEKWFTYSFVAYIFSVLYLVIFVGTAKKKPDHKFIRGAQLTPLDDLNEKLFKAAKNNSRSTLKIDKTILPFEMEPRHMLILGGTGSGKGVLINQLVVQITHRKYRQKTNDKCVFYDPKGEFVAKQFVKGDIIFNPFDERSVGWNIFNEIEYEPDLGTITNSIFLPPGSMNSNDAYWYQSARDVFQIGLLHLKLKNKTTNEDIWNFFSQSLEKIVDALRTLPEGEGGALKHIDKTDATGSASIISILQQRIGFFKHLRGKDGDFSFVKYIRDQGDGTRPHPNLFLLTIQKFKDEFKPLLTLAIDTMARETLSLPDDPNRRIWFVVDELGTLNRMDSILDLETVGRSKGACLVCANQDLGRIEQEYGKPNLRAFFNNFNTVFMFRINEPESAEFLSKAIGERQIIKNSQSRQMSPNDVGDRKSISEQEKVERLILAAELQDFPVGKAVIKIAGYGTSMIIVPAKIVPERHPPFVMRKFAAFGEFDLAEPETSPATTTTEPETPAKPDTEDTERVESTTESLMETLSETIKAEPNESEKLLM